MIDIGVASPSAHGHAMISTATALTSAYASRGSGPTIAQTTNVSDGDDDDERHEPRRDDVGQALNRRARSLRLAHHAHDLREQRVCADALALHHERAGAVDRAAGDADRPALFSTGIGSPVTIDSSTLDAPSITTPSTGIRSPGRTRSRSPTCTSASGTSRSVAIGVDAPRGLRRKAEQVADRRARAAARAQLEHLPEQHEDDDHRRRLEIHGDGAVHPERSAETGPAQASRRRCSRTRRRRRARSA